MLVDNYPSDLNDLFDSDLFLDSNNLSLPEYIDPIPQLHLPYFSNNAFSPSPFLIDNLPPVIHPVGIDPHLVDTPSAITDHGDDDDSEQDDLTTTTPPSAPKPTITIPPSASSSSNLLPPAPPAKPPTAAHKSRKGTVLSGGIVKKSSLPSREKENSALALGVATAKKTAATRHAKNTSITDSSSFSSSSSSPFGLSSIAEHPLFSNVVPPKRASSELSADNDDENDHELPQDWRPSPEVLAKMTSKEKRQLRNKISARNFRIRRKEYISTLEGDIAERDRLLDHFRTQLGSRESENLALRHEIAALKKALLDGRGAGIDAAEAVNVGINLPPPKMLPDQSAAEALMLAESSTPLSPPTTSVTSGLLTPNTQKDLPISGGGSSSAFWGGVGGGGGGGITPVHTTLVPDMSVVLRRALMENINPAMNGGRGGGGGGGQQGAKGNVGGFDGFADANPFTLKTIDAYRMHLWGKMAAQQQQQQQQQSPSSSRTASPSPVHFYNTGYGGLAERLRPQYFSSASSSSGVGGSFGKHGGAGVGSWSVVQKAGNPSTSTSSWQGHGEREETRQQQHALMAAMASQTMLKKLGSAFWEAFVGGSGSGVAGHLGHASYHNGGGGSWDAEKVKRVLEGKAVLRVVDVDTVSSVPTTAAAVQGEKGCERVVCERVCDLLEESMRSLTIGKKAL